MGCAVVTRLVLMLVSLSVEDAAATAVQQTNIALYGTQVSYFCLDFSGRLWFVSPEIQVSMLARIRLARSADVIWFWLQSLCIVS